MVNVGDLLTVLRLQDELSPGVLTAVNQLQDLDKQAQLTAYKITLLGRGLSEAGVMASTLFTVPILGAIDAVVKFGGEFETQMTRVVTLAGATRQQVDEMRGSVLQLAGETAVAPAELAKGMYVLMSTGRSTAEAMDVLRVSAQMTALGMGNMHDTTIAITGAMFAYKETNLTAAEAANVLIKAVQLGNMEIQDLVPAIARVNPVAAALGVTFQDVAAGMATFTHAGVDSAVAATGMRAMLSNILNDSAKTEKGFKALADALKDPTISMENFRKEMTEKGFTTAMVDLMNKVTEAGDAGVSAINKIFPNIRALTEALFVYKTNGGLVVDMMKSMNDGQDQLARGTAELQKTWAFQWEQMKISVEKLWISLSESLFPIFKSTLDLIKSGFPILESIVRWFNEMPVAVQMTALGFAGLAAAIGPVMIFLGQLLMAYGNISRALTTIGWTQSTIVIGANTVALEANTLAANANVIATDAQTASRWRWMSAMGESITNMTLFGKAINIVGAALAGWEIGRLIANIFDLDEKMSGLLSRMKQLGNFFPGAGIITGFAPDIDQRAELARQTQLAQQDAINKAIKNGASITISYSDAIKYNTAIIEGTIKAHKLGTDTNLGYAGSVKDIAGQSMRAAAASQTLLEAVAAMTAKQKAAIDAGKSAGLNPKQILEELKLEGLAVGVTTDMIGVYERQQIKAASAAKTHTQEVNKLNTAFEKIVDTIKVTTGLPDALQIKPEVIEMMNELVGEDVSKKVETLQAAFTQLSMAGKVNANVLEETGKRAGELASKGARLTLELYNIAAATGNLGARANADGNAFAKMFDTAAIKIKITEKDIDELTISHKQWGKELENIGRMLVSVGSQQDGFLGTTISNLGKMIQEWGRVESQIKSTGKTAAQTGQEIAAVLGAIGSIVGSGVSKASKVIGGALAGAATGLAIGAEWGANAGPATMAIGAAIGALAGAVMGWVSANKAAAATAKEAASKLSDLKGSIIAEYGSMEEASKVAGRFGLVLEDSVGNSANDLKQLTKESEALQATLKALANDVERYGLTWENLTAPEDRMAAATAAAKPLIDSFKRMTQAGYDVSAILDGMSGDINIWLSRALDAGTKIPPAMQPILEQLIKMGKLTEENARKLLGLSEIKLDGGSYDDIMAAAERYGLTIDKLGQKMNQLNINRIAQQLSDDWKLLTSDGEDVNAVMSAMAPKVQDVITRSLQMGLEIPANMQPMVEAMIKAGLLTDQFGNKLVDTSKLKFAEPVRDAIDDLIKKIGELIDTLTNAKIPPIRVPVIPDYPNGRPGGGGGGGKPGDSAVPMAAGGDFLVTKPTLFLAGEAGPERASFSGAGKLGSNGQRGGTTTLVVPVQVSGREIARVVLQELPGEFFRAGGVSK